MEDPSNYFIKCPECNGQGTKEVEKGEGPDSYLVNADCNFCGCNTIVSLFDIHVYFTPFYDWEKKLFERVDRIVNYINN